MNRGRTPPTSVYRVSSAAPVYTRDAVIEQAAATELGMTPEQIKSTTIARLRQQLEDNTEYRASSFGSSRHSVFKRQPQAQPATDVRSANHYHYGSVPVTAPAKLPNSVAVDADGPATKDVSRQQFTPVSSTTTTTTTPTTTAPTPLSSTSATTNTPPPAATTTLDHKLQQLTDTIAEIEREFGDCSPSLAQYIAQVRMLHSPGQVETLNSYFSTAEQSRIHSSLRSNTKEAYWNLYRVLLHVYHYRIDYIQKMSESLSMESQQHFQERHKLLFALINRLKQLTE